MKNTSFHTVVSLNENKRKHKVQQANKVARDRQKKSVEIEFESFSQRHNDKLYVLIY